MFLISAFFCCPVAAEEEVRITPVPDWVEPVPAKEPSDIPARQLSNGVFYLVVDRQTRVAGSSVERHHHFAKKLMTPKAVEEESTISMVFDPAYEQLHIHGISIIRDEVARDGLAGKKIHLLQRETKREYLIYDGAKTADIILEDVRPGDIIDYQYTVRGWNPALEGRYSSRFSLRWNEPAARHFLRLVWPAGRDLEIRVSGTDDILSKMVSRHWVEYMWDEKDVPPVSQDSHIPSWFDPYAELEFSDFGTWDDVRLWALDAYEFSGDSLIVLEKTLEKIVEKTASPQEKVAAVLSFVQNDIRYLGMEEGMAGYVPSQPAITLKRRFGDCKDKALLMAGLLRASGIEAYPLLVDTDIKHRVSDFLPSPLVFDHVMVEVRLEGKKYWFDPTLPHFKGGFDELYEPDTRCGLLIAPEAGGLVEKETRLIKPTIKAEETWDFTRGLDEPGTFEVESVYEGWDAADIREYAASGSASEMEKDYLNFFARYYPGIEQQGSIRISDEPGRNSVKVSERYAIKGGWPVDDGNQEFTFYAHEFNSYKKKPSTIKRSMPLGIEHPVWTSKRTRVLLAGEWNIRPENVVIQNDAFFFNYSSEFKGNEVVLEYQYKSKMDHVPVSRMDQYLKDIRKIRECLSYTLEKPLPQPAKKRENRQFNMALLVISGVFLLGCVLCIVDFIWDKVKNRKEERLYYPVSPLKFIVLWAGSLSLYN